MFELKKIVASLLMPLPFLLIIGFIGLICLIFLKRYKIGTFFVSIALFGIFLVSFQPFSSSLFMPMERQYPPFIAPTTSVDYVVALGAGHVDDKDIPITSQLSRNGMMRLIEAIRIQRMYPNAKLIVSGYDAGTTVSSALIMADIAVSLGVNKADIILLETPRNTEEEAQQIASFVGDKSLVLVTSAFHMARAIQELKNVGIDPIPAPTNFMASNNIEQVWQKFAPKSRYLMETELYWHETLGKWWKSISSEDAQ